MPKAAESKTEMSENRAWHAVRDLLGHETAAPVAVAGAPLGRESITPGPCDLAPDTVRRALQRMSVYDLETGTDLGGLKVFDAGDADVAALTPAEAFAPIRELVAQHCAARPLTILLGGNNAVTRPGVHGMDASLRKAGLLTLDA